MLKKYILKKQQISLNGGGKKIHILLDGTSSTGKSTISKFFIIVFPEFFGVFLILMCVFYIFLFYIIII